MRRLILIVGVVLGLTLSCHAQRFSVRVVGISDGDTFTVVNRDNLQLKVRIYGIDAPEKGQAYGNQSKKKLSSIIMGRNIDIDVLSQEKWGRYVARVYTSDGKDVALLMLESGMAWHYTRYDSTLSYSKAQENAKRGKKGLWADTAPMAPWEFRKNAVSRK